MATHAEREARYQLLREKLEHLRDHIDAHLEHPDNQEYVAYLERSFREVGEHLGWLGARDHQKKDSE